MQANSNQELKVANSRLCKINHLEHQMYGVRMIGYMGCEELYTKTTYDQEQLYNALKPYCTLFHITSVYRITTLTVRGRSYKIHIGQGIADGKLYAIKSIEKKPLLAELKQSMSFVHELEILRSLNHENVIKLHEVFEDASHMHLVYENLNGCELSFQIRKNGIFEECDAARIMKQILQALQYLHSIGIMHRDIKPQVITLCNDGLSAKITEFNFAVQSLGKLQYTRCGSPGYMAPEIISGSGYNSKVDIFSAGCIMYTLITGKNLFKGNTFQEVLSKNISCHINYFGSSWKKMSLSAKDLLQKMLNPDPSMRPEASHCLQSEWMRNYGDSNFYYFCSSIQ